MLSRVAQLTDCPPSNRPTPSSTSPKSSGASETHAVACEWVYWVDAVIRAQSLQTGASRDIHGSVRQMRETCVTCLCSNPRTEPRAFLFLFYSCFPTVFPLCVCLSFHNRCLSCTPVSVYLSLYLCFFTTHSARVYVPVSVSRRYVSSVYLFFTTVALSLSLYLCFFTTDTRTLTFSVCVCLIAAGSPSCSPLPLPSSPVSHLLLCR